MKESNRKTLRKNSPYSASITREQFLFYEMRTTAQLVCEGLSRDEIIERIVRENLYQYPTEKTLKQMARTCLKRLELLGDKALIQALVSQPSDVAKQICLYAMMKQHRLVWDFMITVIGSKYQNVDTSFSKMDVNTYFMRLQEQDDWAAAWSEKTIAKAKQVLMKVLVENEYLDSIAADRLNPVLISPILENAIRANGDSIALSAFNCLT